MLLVLIKPLDAFRAAAIALRGDDFSDPGSFLVRLLLMDYCTELRVAVMDCLFLLRMHGAVFVFIIHTCGTVATDRRHRRTAIVQCTTTPSPISWP